MLTSINPLGERARNTRWGRTVSWYILGSTAGGLVQLGEVMSGGSYLSQHDLRIHFGLGDRKQVDKAVVL